MIHCGHRSLSVSFKERTRRSEINLRIYWHACILYDIPPQIAHTSTAMPADKSQYYVQKTTMLPQIIIADGGAAERCKVSLGHYRVMPRCDLDIVADFKAVICDCDYRRSCRERLRDTKSSIFFITYPHMFQLRWFCCRKDRLRCDWVSPLEFWKKYNHVSHV